MNRLKVGIMSAAAVMTVSPLLGEDVSRAEFEAMKNRLTDLERSAAENRQEGAEPKWYDRFELAVGATGVLQGSSGADDMSEDGDKADATMSLDLELMAKATENGLFYTHVESGSGDGLDGDIATLSGFNDDADDDATLRLTEVWYEQTFGEAARLRVGKIDLTTDFDTNAVANSETDQFLSSGFVNGLAVEFPDDNGFGTMLWVSPTKLIDVGVGLANADSDWDDVFDAPFAIAEVDFKPVFGTLQGNYRFYGWYNGKDHEDLTDGSTDAKNHGFGVSFDQQLNDIFTAFVRYNWQRGEVAQVEQSWSAGFSMAGSVFGRESDAIGLAYGMAMIGNDWEKSAAANNIDCDDEGHFELFYKYAVNEHLAISPDIQWVTNANGDSASDDVFVFGLRTQISF